MPGKAPAVVVAICCCAPATVAGTFSFTGAGSTPSWSDPGNWSGGVAPPGDGSADIAISGGAALTLDGSRSIRSLAIAAGGVFTISAGSVPASFLSVGSGSISRSARGRLVVQVPLLASGGASLAGFEAQSALSTSSAIVLDGASWPSGTAVTNLLIVSAVPASSSLTLASGAWLDLAGAAEAIGSLAGAGSVTNTAAGSATLVVGADGTNSNFSGFLGAKLSDQAAVGPIDLVKIGPGALTFTGASSIGGSIRVIDGALCVNGTFTSAGGVVPAASSATHGTLCGIGTAGAISTAANLIPGGAVAPGAAGSKGILHAASADLRRGTLRIRMSAYKTAGVDYDQLIVNSGGVLFFDADSEVVLDLAGLAATGSVNVALFPNLGNPGWTFQPQQIRVLNNANNFAVTLTQTVDHLTVAVKNTAVTPPAFVVTPAHGLVTTEGGRAATFTVALGKAPAAPVAVPIASSNTGEGQVSPASLIFTTANWNVSQQVTVTGVDDSVPDGAQPYSISVGPATSADAAFQGQSAAPVGAVNLDDDLITISPESGLVTSPPPDAPQMATLTFHAANAADLRILAVPNALVAPVAPMLLVPSSGTTPSPLALRLAGAHQLTPGCAPGTLAFAAVISTDPLYSGYEVPSLSLCNQGDHAPIARSSSPGVFTLGAPGLLATATDPDLDPLSAHLVSPPAHGDVIVAADGSFTYVPVQGFSGSDSFTWSASDGAIDSAPAVVSFGSAASDSLGCAIDGDLRPGGAAVLTVSVQNTGVVDLVRTVLRVTPTGLALDGSVEGAEPSPAGLTVPVVPAGASATVRVHGHVSAGRFAQAGASVQLFDASGAPIGAPAAAFRETQPLVVNVGGCTSSAGAAWPLLGLLALLRRKTASAT